MPIKRGMDWRSWDAWDWEVEPNPPSCHQELRGVSALYHELWWGKRATRTKRWVVEDYVDNAQPGLTLFSLNTHWYGQRILHLCSPSRIPATRGTWRLSLALLFFHLTTNIMGKKELLWLKNNPTDEYQRLPWTGEIRAFLKEKEGIFYKWRVSCNLNITCYYHQSTHYDTSDRQLEDQN